MLLSQIFTGISLDCLDGMQARKTGRCSKLGEVLDHSLDAANVPIIGCCVLFLLFPDIYTVLISVISGSMIYNAQLVIYRHHHVFVLPPVTGPAAQAMASAASVLFGVFFLFFSRDDYLMRIFLVAFAMFGNLAQFQNCYFYGRHLVSSFETSCLAPHVRFTLVMCLHGTMLLAGFLTTSEYMLSAILLAYRLNGTYVLDTLQAFRPFSETHTKADVRAQDTEWRWDCIIGLVVLLSIGVVTGTGPLFQLAHFAGMAACVAANVRDLVIAAPNLK